MICKYRHAWIQNVFLILGTLSQPLFLFLILSAIPEYFNILIWYCYGGNARDCIFERMVTAPPAFSIAPHAQYFCIMLHVDFAACVFFLNWLICKLQPTNEKNDLQFAFRVPIFYYIRKGCKTYLGQGRKIREQIFNHFAI